MIHYYDTSAILDGDLPSPGSYISSTVIQELENIKTSSHKDEDIKASARKAVRFIFNNVPVLFIPDSKSLEWVNKKFNFLPETNDNTILKEALILQRQDEVILHTGDLCLSLMANKCNMAVEFTGLRDNNVEVWGGWRKYYLTEEEQDALLKNPQDNVLQAKTNEYCMIFDKATNQETIILVWTGLEYRGLKYKPINSENVSNRKIKPLNPEQSCLFDLLQNPKVPVKVTTGGFGHGKSYLMLAQALQSLQEGRFNKIVFVRNNIEVKDTGEMAALPGDEIEKIFPFLMPIADHVGGKEALSDLIFNQELIEPVHLGYLRGRSINKSIIFCDEAENLTKQQIQLLIGRVGAGSELHIAGDLRQVDRKIFEKNNGLRAILNGLAGNKLFGAVKLVKTERSEVAQLADLLDEI